jgi:hypothetical protein
MSTIEQRRDDGESQNYNDQYFGGEEEMDQMDEYPEYVEMEIPNNIEITSNHATVLAVANFLNQEGNEDFANKYEYTVEHRPSDNGNNFIAIFRLKRHFRENSSVAPSI